MYLKWKIIWPEQDRYTKELTMKSIEVMKSKYDTFYDKLEAFYDNIGS